MPQAFDPTVDIPFWLEVVAIVAGAVAGALRAIREHLAISGVVALAIALGLGGGIIRDTLLQSGTPVAFTDHWFLPIALAAGLVTLLLARPLDRVVWLLYAVDALAVGLYAVLGADKALLYGVPPVGAALIGVLAGTGGALLADLAVGVPPVLFRPGALLGVAAALGTAVYVAGFELTDARASWFVIGVAIVTLTRVYSLATGRGVGTAADLSAKSEDAFRRLGRPLSTGRRRGRERSVIYVAPDLMEWGDDPSRTYLKVRGSETESWRPVESIEGFVHRASTGYVLEVERNETELTAAAGGLPRYRLVRVLDTDPDSS